jgi:hydroxymethylpyrimidine pyrophosphatase-like HAD family hydrolase
MIVAVDFDGTLCKHDYPEIGEPNYKVVAKLRRMRQEGHKLILWTCRSGEHLQEAVEACKDWGLEFDAVNENIDPAPDFNPKKVFAHIYLDDRALHVDNF